MSWCTDTGKRRKRWDMSEASLTEFTMFGNEYEAIDSRICDGCVFSVKKGTAGVTDPRLYSQLPFTAILVVSASIGLTAGMLSS